MRVHRIRPHQHRRCIRRVLIGARGVVALVIRSLFASQQQLDELRVTRHA
jgi:hypothetical protein